MNNEQPISFRVSDLDRVLIQSIVARAFRDRGLLACLHFVDDGEAVARQTLTMDVTATHANGCPINLARLLDADDVTFGHDLTGIQSHLDRRNAKLRGGFAPRMTMTAAELRQREDDQRQKEDSIKALVSAADHAGAAGVAGDFARAQAESDRRKRKARNARRRKDR